MFNSENVEGESNEWRQYTWQADVFTGIQYRTGIYYEDETLLSDIKTAVREEQEKYDRPLAVEVKHLENFYAAEEYHQKYLDKNPGGYCHIPAKLMEMA